MPFNMNTRSSKQHLNTRHIRTTIDPKYAIVAFRETLTCAIYNVQNVDKPRKKVSGVTIKVEVNDGLRKGTIVSTADQFDKLLPILHKFDVSSFFGVIKRKIRDAPYPTSTKERKALKRPTEIQNPRSPKRQRLYGYRHTHHKNSKCTNAQRTIKRKCTNERILKRPTEIQIPRSPKRQRLYGYGHTHHKNSKCRRCLFGRDMGESSILALRIPVTSKNTPTLKDTTVFDVDLPADSPFFECLSPMSPSPSPAEPQKDESGIVPTSEVTCTEPTTPPTTSYVVHNSLSASTNDATTTPPTTNNAVHNLLSRSTNDASTTPPITSNAVHNLLSRSTNDATAVQITCTEPITPPITSNAPHNLLCRSTNYATAAPPTTSTNDVSNYSPVINYTDTQHHSETFLDTIHNAHIVLSGSSPQDNVCNYPLPTSSSSDIVHPSRPGSSPLDNFCSRPLPTSPSSDIVLNPRPVTRLNDVTSQQSTSSITCNAFSLESTDSNLLPILPTNNTSHVQSIVNKSQNHPILPSRDIVYIPQLDHLPPTTTKPHTSRPCEKPTASVINNHSPSSNCLRMYGYEHENLLALIEPVHDIDNEAFLQEISSLEYPSPNKDMSYSYADEGEEDKDLSEKLSPIVEPISSLKYPSPSKDMSRSYADEGEEETELSGRLSPIVEPPLTNAGPQNILIQITGQETQYHNNHTFILPPAPRRQLQSNIHNVNRYQSFTTSLTKTIPQKNLVHTPIENILSPIYVSSSRALSIQNSYPGALPEHTHSTIHQTDSVSFPSIIPAQISYRQTYSQNLVSSSNPTSTIVQSTFSQVCPQPPPHPSNVIPVDPQFPLEQAPHQYPDSAVSNETTPEPESSTSTSVHTQKGKNCRKKSRAKSKPQHIITDDRILRLKACEIVGRNITTNRIQYLINQLPQEDVIDDTTKPYVIPFDVLREVIQNSDGSPENFARKLLCRIFSLGELLGRSVKCTGRVKKTTYVDSRKIDALQNAVFTWFPGSVYIWSFCVHRMNVHIRYINQKLKNIYNPNCLSHSN